MKGQFFLLINAIMTEILEEMTIPAFDESETVIFSRLTMFYLRTMVKVLLSPT